MGLGDLAGKAQDALKTEQGQKAAGDGLNRAAGATDKATGGKHTDHINQGKDAVSDRLGLGGDDKGQQQNQQKNQQGKR